MTEGAKHQHSKILQVHQDLLELGNTVQVWYWVSDPKSYRVVEPAVMRNLMQSELEYLQQEYD
jgi:hypothetical protein